MRKVETRPTKGGGTSYQVRFRMSSISPKTGRPLQASRTFVTRQAAQRFAKLLDVLGPEEALKQLAIETRPGAPTLDELADQFLIWKAGKVRSDRTVADYRRDYRNWIKPTLGDLTADAVTEADIQRWVDAMTAGRLGNPPRKLQPKSVADRHAILHGIYAWAVHPSRRLVDHNPCVGTDLPARRKGQPKGLRPAEWQALYAALRQGDRDAADLALFLLSSGWRFSEAAALTAYAVEDYGDKLYVTMGQVLRRNARGEHVIVVDAKSEAGNRRIRLDPEAAAMVRRRLEAVTGDGLVLTTKTGAKWSNNNFRDRHWNPAVKTANLTRHPTPHWLRHTNVAFMVMAGAKLPEIQRRIGHEDIRTTIDTYGRMIDDVSDDALAAFAAFRDQAPAKQRGRLDR